MVPDEVQPLRMELVHSLRKTYSIKRGEQTPPPDDGCTVVEATVAFACANREPELAVLAKSKIGSLWESIEKPPYLLLFNAGVGPDWTEISSASTTSQVIDRMTWPA
jgi:hypothetical protein